MALANETDLLTIQNDLNRFEAERFSNVATLSSTAIRRKPENHNGHRQPFAMDADRILHSRAFTRYIDKTQVFSLVENDHITHRVLHVQIVSRVARTIGRFLGLNEDLIEAISLGHDIGHPPFGHEGEVILSKLCVENGIDSFQHNIQSIQFLDHYEKKGEGWNLSLQVLDGILCHDGEVHNQHLSPRRDKTFTDLDEEISQKSKNRLMPIRPMSLEGCVVRLADTISYIGRDIEDAIELELINRNELPTHCVQVLGDSNGTIVYTLVSDLIESSRHTRDLTAQKGSKYDFIGFSKEKAEALLQLKKFNYERIYKNPAFKPDHKKIHHCYEKLFAYYLSDLQKMKNHQDKKDSFLGTMSDSYIDKQPEAALVRDYIAGMTDDYFLRKAKELGCEIPQRRCLPN